MVDRPSSIDRLPPEVQEVIGKLRVQGRTIDEIVAHLRTMDVEVSRSAMGRHVKSLAAMQERLRSSRQLATALVDRFGEQPDNKLARLNMELMHGIVLQIATATQEGEDGEPQPVTFDPESAMFLASAIQKLASAEKTDADLRIRLRGEIAKEATKKLDAGVRSGDIDADAVAKAKRILGFDA